MFVIFQPHQWSLQHKNIFLTKHIKFYENKVTDLVIFTGS